MFEFIRITLAKLFGALAFVFFISIAPALSQDVLPSWNEGSAKSSIIEFVTAVTKVNGPEYVKPSDRKSVV